jgi:hypothetical protein
MGDSDGCTTCELLRLLNCALKIVKVIKFILRIFLWRPKPGLCARQASTQYSTMCYIPSPTLCIFHTKERRKHCDMLQHEEPRTLKKAE